MGPTLKGYAQQGFTVPLTYMSCYTEFLGGALIIIGFLTRPAAFAVMINMCVAASVMMPRGFIMGMAAYPFSLMISAILILLAGPMDYSIDALLLGNPSAIHASREA